MDRVGHCIGRLKTMSVGTLKLYLNRESASTLTWPLVLPHGRTLLILFYGGRTPHSQAAIQPMTLQLTLKLGVARWERERFAPLRSTGSLQQQKRRQLILKNKTTQIRKMTHVHYHENDPQAKNYWKKQSLSYCGEKPQLLQKESLFWGTRKDSHAKNSTEFCHLNLGNPKLLRVIINPSAGDITGCELWVRRV